MATCLQAIDDKPGRRLFPRDLKAQPAASEVSEIHALRTSGRIGSQVDDFLAVDFVLAHCERLQPIGEALRAFAKRRHYVERQVERRLALTVEATAGQRGTLAR